MIAVVGDLLARAQAPPAPLTLAADPAAELTSAALTP